MLAGGMGKAPSITATCATHCLPACYTASHLDVHNQHCSVQHSTLQYCSCHHAKNTQKHEQTKQLWQFIQSNKKGCQAACCTLHISRILTLQIWSKTFLLALRITRHISIFRNGATPVVQGDRNSWNLQGAVQHLHCSSQSFKLSCERLQQNMQ